MDTTRTFIPPGVCVDIAAARGYRMIESKCQLAEYAHRLREHQQRLPGLLIPVYRLGEPTPYTYVLRPDNPRISGDGKFIKYEWPKGIPLCLDILPRYNAAFADPTIQIWFTEGAKKSDALASAFGVAIVPININGVWGWRRKGKDGISRPLEDFDKITWSRRSVVLAFDNDVMRKPQVQTALRALSRLLNDRGATVRVLVLPEVLP